MVPFGLGALYLLKLGSYADTYWTAVLIPTYSCYATAAFLKAMPPRYAGRDLPSPGPIRRFNLWILRNVSIHANTFPSGHATAACAIALVLPPFSATAGLIFAMLAVGICIGAVTGRYHYTVDVVLGALLSVATVGLMRVL
jgi:membrane-associated phospholipid phosphatase